MTAIALVDAWDPADTRARDAIAAALRQLPPEEELSLAATDRETLIRIYRRRLTRAHNVLGTDDLLQALERHASSDVLGTAASVGGMSIVLWLDTGVSKIVGCLVGSATASSGTAGPEIS